MISNPKRDKSGKIISTNVKRLSVFISPISDIAAMYY